MKNRKTTHTKLWPGLIFQTITLLLMIIHSIEMEEAIAAMSPACAPANNLKNEETIIKNINDGPVSPPLVPPRIRVYDNGGEIVLFERGNWTFPLGSSWGHSQKYRLECRASYPLKLTTNKSIIKHMLNSRVDEVRHERTFHNFYDRSTYSYYLITEHFLEHADSNFSLTCQLSSPQQSTGQQGQVGEEAQLQKSLNIIVTNKNVPRQPKQITFTLSDPSYNGEVNDSTKVTNVDPSAAAAVATQNVHRACSNDANFYLEEGNQTMPYGIYPGIFLRCKLPMGKGQGRTRETRCSYKSTCNDIIRTVEKTPWTLFAPKIQSGGEILYLNPLVITCEEPPSGGEINGTTPMPNLDSDLDVHFDFRYRTVPGMRYDGYKYFLKARGKGNLDASSTMIYLTKFSRLQRLHSFLYVKCSVSAYYATTPFQFALELEGRSELELLPVHRHTDFDSYQKTYYQIQQISLNTLSLKKIYCFAGVQDSQRWINASRSIHVTESLEYYEHKTCPTHRQPTKVKSNGTGGKFEERPKIQLLDHETQQIIFSSGATNETPHIDVGKFGTIICTASYPVQLRRHGSLDSLPLGVQVSYAFAEPNQTTTKEHYEGQGHHQFANLFNFSRLLVTGMGSEDEKYFWLFPQTLTLRCQSIENPCLYTICSYRRLFAQHQHRISFPNSTLTNNLKNDTTNTDMMDEEVDDKGSCDVIFYYQKINFESHTTYAFFCAFPFDSPGHVSMESGTGSDTFVVQPKECWRPYFAEETCKKCEPYLPLTFASFVIMCSRGETEAGLPPTKSQMVNQGFYGLPKEVNGGPEFYTSLEDVDPETVMELNEFAPLQLAHTTLHVSCTSSSFYLTHNILFVLEYQGDGANGGRQSFHEGHMTFPVEYRGEEIQHHTLDLHLVDTNLVKIYCLGYTQQGNIVVNKSRPISVADSLSPTVRLGYYDQDKDAAAVKNREFDFSAKILHSLPLNSYNQSIVCHAFGYRTPKIRWSTTSQSPLSSPLTKSSNSSHVQSTLTFSHVHKEIAGIYICTAENELGVATGSMELGVSEAYQWTLMTIVWTSCGTVLVLTVLVTLVIFQTRRYRDAKKRLRNLTPEEIKEFAEGCPETDESVAVELVEKEKRTGPEKALVLPFTAQIPPEKLIIVKNSILGKGNFGVVYRGILGGKAVAIKTILKTADTTFFKEFLRELKIQAYIGPHDHIVEFLGADISKIEQRLVYAVLELSPGGNLCDYMRERTYFPKLAEKPRENELGVLSMFSFCRQVASGMEFLEMKNVIHADLACRNILVFENEIVKITDFGLARQLYQCALYKKSQKDVPLPVAWMAIESLTKHQFSHKSDVWSFGVVVWEIFSLGGEPFHGMNWDFEFMRDIESGQRRLRQPHAADDMTYKEMEKCWRLDPGDRPSFLDLKIFFEGRYQQLKIDQEALFVGLTSSAVVLDSDFITKNSEVGCKSSTNFEQEQNPWIQYVQLDATMMETPSAYTNLEPRLENE